VIDTMPLPVCQWVRGVRSRLFPNNCRLWLLLCQRVSLLRLQIGFASFPNRDDNFGGVASGSSATAVNFTEELASGGGKIVLGDKGFIDQFRGQLLEDRYGIRLIVPKRKNMKEQNENPIDKITTKTYRKIRKVVETVNSHLTERLNVAKIRVHDLWHFQSRLIRKILAHTVAVFLNLQLNRKPLDLDGLVLN